MPMQPPVERAAALMTRLGRAAVPLDELVRLLREEGLALSEPVLLRSLAAESARFRLIEPWRALRAGGWMILSGVLEPEADGLIRAAGSLGLRPEEVDADGEWRSLLLRSG